MLPSCVPLGIKQRQSDSLNRVGGELCILTGCVRRGPAAEARLWLIIPRGYPCDGIVGPGSQFFRLLRIFLAPLGKLSLAGLGERPAVLREVDTCARDGVEAAGVVRTPH